MVASAEVDAILSLMAKKRAKRSPGQKPPPRCKALLLCDNTIVEAVTGKVSIIGTFDSFFQESFPGVGRPFMAFLQITDGVGRYEIVIEIHDLRENQVLARATGTGIEFPDRLTKMNLMIPVPPLPLPHSGVYDLVVFANGQEIDRQRFRAESSEDIQDEPYSDEESD